MPGSRTGARVVLSRLSPVFVKTARGRRCRRDAQIGEHGTDNGGWQVADVNHGSPGRNQQYGRHVLAIAPRQLAQSPENGAEHDQDHRPSDTASHHGTDIGSPYQRPWIAALKLRS